MDGASLDKFIEQQVTNSGWIVEKEGGSIVLPQNEFNHPELKKNTGENVPLEHIARIFPILGWTNSWEHCKFSFCLLLSCDVHF